MSVSSRVLVPLDDQLVLGIELRCSLVPHLTEVSKDAALSIVLVIHISSFDNPLLIAEFADCLAQAVLSLFTRAVWSLAMLSLSSSKLLWYDYPRLWRCSLVSMTSFIVGRNLMAACVFSSN